MATVFRRTKPLDFKKLLEDCDDKASSANRCLQVFVRETQADMDSPGVSTALRSLGLLDVLSSTPAGPSGAAAPRCAPCIHARLRRLATKPGEKSGLDSPGGGVRPVIPWRVLALLMGSGYVQLGLVNGKTHRPWICFQGFSPLGIRSRFFSPLLQNQ